MRAFPVKMKIFKNKVILRNNAWKAILSTQIEKNLVLYYHFIKRRKKITCFFENKKTRSYIC